jgi:hypothetical protein
MPYASAGLRSAVNGAVNIWVLDTVDSVATATGAGYVSDGTSSSNNSTPGRGMQVGDAVLIRVVGALTANGFPPATCTDQAWAYVSTATLTTGACTLTLTHTNA